MSAIIKLNFYVSPFHDAKKFELVDASSFSWAQTTSQVTVPRSQNYIDAYN